MSIFFFHIYLPSRDVNHWSITKCKQYDKCANWTISHYYLMHYCNCASFKNVNIRSIALDFLLYKVGPRLLKAHSIMFSKVASCLLAVLAVSSFTSAAPTSPIDIGHICDSIALIFNAINTAAPFETVFQRGVTDVGLSYPTGHVSFVFYIFL